MPTLLPPPSLTSAAAVFLGPPGAVAGLARRRGVSRQALYREADAVVCALDPRPHQEELARLRQQVAELRRECDRLQGLLAAAVVVDADRQAEFAATGQALGVSLSAAHALLRVVLRAATPS